MGKQVNLHFRGARGNLLYYERYGEYYVRTRPIHVKQTIATKASAGKFGLAVRNGKAIRTVLAPILPDAKDRQLMFRLNTALYKWLLTEPANNNISYQPVPALTGFRFNEKTSLGERLKLPLQAGWQQQGGVAVTIPAMVPVKDIAAPAHTLSIELKIIAICCSIAGHTILDTQSAAISIPYTTSHIPAQEISLPFTQQPSSLCMLAAGLKYSIRNMHGATIENKMQWLPAGIIDAGVCIRR